MDITKSNSKEIFWQAHRGGGGFERPDNTLLSLNYAWAMGGIPEVDLRLTADGVLICQHDNTLSRTTNAPEDIAQTEISQLTFEEIRKYDAGEKFAKAYRGEKIPAFHEVLDLLHDDHDKVIYADLKDYNAKLQQEFFLLVDMYEAADQIIVCSCDYELNCQMHKTVPGINTMQWIGGSAGEQIATFEKLAENNFACLEQIQLHLNAMENQTGSWRYTLDADFLQDALKICSDKGISMQVFPWLFEKDDLFKLLDIGIRWFATDEPSKFCKTIKEWQDL